MRTFKKEISAEASKYGFDATKNTNFMRKFSPREMIRWVSNSENLSLASASERTMDHIVETVKNAHEKLFCVEMVFNADERPHCEDYYFLANEGFLYLISPVWWADEKTQRRGCVEIADELDGADIFGDITVREHDAPTGEVFYTLKVR